MATPVPGRPIGVGVWKKTSRIDALHDAKNPCFAGSEASMSGATR